ncbi:Polyadenylate-binding protein 2, partial [Mucuna pruriens]
MVQIDEMSESTSRFKTSLYVGDLDQGITETQLYDLFNEAGQVTSVRICRDLETRRPLGYGYVNFSNAYDAAKAMEELNFTPLNGKPIRVTYSFRDPSIRKSEANIFVKNLDQKIDNRSFRDIFLSFGNIVSCKVVMDNFGRSKGHGFVQFESEASAQEAIERLNGMLINDKRVYVGHFERRKDRDSKFTSVFVKNLSQSTSTDDLKRVFGEFGDICSALVIRDEDGNSKCFGFVNFKNTDSAARAVQELHGKNLDGKDWFVGKALAKSDWDLLPDFSTKDSFHAYQPSNLYLKNLHDFIGDADLKALFSRFGRVTSCKVMRDENGVSKGSGFVAFETHEEALQALRELNGYMAAGKPLYVSFAQKKEERRARLQAQFSEVRPVPIAPVAPPMLPYPPPLPGQHFFYRQPVKPPRAPIHQAGFGYEQQYVPGMRPSGTAVPRFFVPMVQKGQHPGGHGHRGVAGPTKQLQKPPALMQQQLVPRGAVYRCPAGTSMQNFPLAGVTEGMVYTYDVGGQPVPIQTLSMALAYAPPEHQKIMLGEALYPLVEDLEHDAAPKITGMLLEMDKPEVLHLIESPEDLRAKVVDAMQALRNDTVDQRAALSPDDHDLELEKKTAADL